MRPDLGCGDKVPPGTINVSAPVVERILGHAARCDGAPFLTLMGRDQRETRLTLAQLVARAQEWAHRYAQAGLRPGDKVVVILDHGEALYTSYLGALLGGYCPAYFAQPSEKIDAACYRASVQVLLQVIGGDFVVSSREIFGRLDLKVPRGLFDDGARFHGTENLPRVSAPAPEAPLFLQFSSGTTGLKKCVAVRADDLLWQVDAYAERLQAGEGDRMASWLPLYHDMGLIACFFLPLLRRIPVVAMSPFDWVKAPGMLLDAMTRHRATLVWLPNFAFNFLAARAVSHGGPRWDLSSLRAVVNCSEPVLDQSHKVFTSRFGEFGLRADAITTCYAMAENTFAVTSSRPGAPLVLESLDLAELSSGRNVMPRAEGETGVRTVVGSGTALPGVKVAILDESGRELPEGHAGEIAVASPSLFSGYYGQRADSEDALRGGRFPTGDFGYLRNGELFVIGRIKDTIIVGGRNIFPQDVEAIVSETVGAIPGRCVAIGVDDLALGTQSLVVIAETHGDQPGARRELRRRIRKAIVDQMDIVPSDVVLAKHMWLRKATSGKPARALNRQRYLDAKNLDLDGGGPQPAAQGGGGLIEAVRACVVKAINLDGDRANPEFGDDDDLQREGVLDSFSLVGLQLALEDHFGVAAVRLIRERPEVYRSVHAMAAVLAPLAMHPEGLPDAAFVPPTRPEGSRRNVTDDLAPQLRDGESQPYEWVAYLMRRAAPGFQSATLNSDEHGFRHTYRDGRLLTFREFSGSSRPRAIVLGNSFAYGIGTTHDAKTFTSCLNTLEGSRAYLWYNFSQRASVIRQERLAFELYAQAIPELVLWVTGINNLISLIVGEGRPDNPAPFVGERYFASRMMPDRRYGRASSFAERYRAMLEQMEMDLSTLALRLSGQGRLLFCLQPSASWIEKKFTAEEEELISRFDATSATLRKAHAPRVLRPLYSRFSSDAAAICERWNVAYLDCNQDPRLREHNWLFIDRAHMTDAGHALTAEMTVEWLRGRRG